MKHTTHTKLLNLVTLIVFLPVATGCSTVGSLAIPDDPASGEDPVVGKAPMIIKGYVDHAGLEHEWFGRVHAAGPDSLQFDRPGPGDGNAPPTAEQPITSLRLARADVSALLVDEPQHGRSTLLAVALIAGLVALLWVPLSSADLYEI